MFNRIVALRDSWGKKGGPAAPAARPRRQGAPAAPRDPAAGLSDGERAAYDALVARGVGEEEAAVVAASPPLAALFEDVVAAGASAREAAVLLVHDLRPALGERDLAESKAAAPALAGVLGLVESGALTRSAASEAVAALVAEGGTAEAVVEARGLAAVRDADALAPAVDAALAENPDEVARYRAGEERLFGYFVGQAMRRAPGGADAKAVQDMLRERLAA